MQLGEYLRVLTKRGWIILVTIVIAVAAALLISQLQTPVYRSTIFLNVMPGRLDWGLQQTIKALMRNYAINIASRETAVGVIESLNLEDIAPDQLRGKLTVEPVQSDFLIRIDADDYDPLMARDIAQTTAEKFVARIKAYMLAQDKRDRVKVTIRDYALPGRLHKPRRKVNVLVGGLFGGVMGVAVVFILQWLEADLIRTSEDIERYTEVAVLGVIPIAASSSFSRSSRHRGRTWTRFIDPTRRNIS